MIAFEQLETNSIFVKRRDIIIQFLITVFFYAKQEENFDIDSID